LTPLRRRPASRERLLALLGRQLRDERVLAAIAAVPRELFVAPELRSRAWQNSPLPIGNGQTISQPLVVARMCEALELSGDERILDVGTGSGYHAAVLARLGRSVVSIERDPELSELARRNLAAARIEDVALVVGDGASGYVQQMPYDAINVAAAAQSGVPKPLLEQLAPGGRLIAPVGATAQRLMLVHASETGPRYRDLGPVRVFSLRPDATAPASA